MTSKRCYCKVIDVSFFDRIVKPNAAKNQTLSSNPAGQKVRSSEIGLTFALFLGSNDDDDFQEYWIAIGVCLGLFVLIVILLIFLALRRRRKYYVTR